jgi:hypothetical protein
MDDSQIKAFENHVINMVDFRVEAFKWIGGFKDNIQYYVNMINDITQADTNNTFANRLYTYLYESKHIESLSTQVILFEYHLYSQSIQTKIIQHVNNPYKITSINDEINKYQNILTNLMVGNDCKIIYVYCVELDIMLRYNAIDNLNVEKDMTSLLKINDVILVNVSCSGDVN